MQLFLTIIITFLLTGCGQQQRSLEEIKNKGELRVLTLNSANTFYEDRDGKYAGFEYDLAREFATYIGVKAKFIVIDSVEELLEDLSLGKGDIAAAGITITPKRKKQFLFSPSYQKVSMQAICARGIRPKNIKEFSDKKIIVTEGSSYEEYLKKLKVKHFNLEWMSIKDQTASQVFKMLADKQSDCTLVDSNIASLYLRYYPRLERPFEVNEKQQLAWSFHPESVLLHEQSKIWFEIKKIKKYIQALKQKYYGFAQDFDPYDIEKFKERIKTRLPSYLSLVKKAAQNIQWPWKLLAAVAYQESHWNPKAKSPTGVRGFMMLTRNTAKSLGVTNRLDPKQSIMGGGRYLKKMEMRLPHYIKGKDRQWMALAAYNVGYSHLRDAWGVAAWRELNPNKWNSIRQVLPLLARKKIYKRLPHGYARGSEPVIYIDRIKNYYDLLRKYWHDK